MAITYHSGLVDELSLIERFVASDGPDSARAFEELAHRIRRFLGKYLTSLLPIEQDREDVSEIVIQRLLSRQHGVEFKSRGAWWAYVATIARRCAYDRLKNHSEGELPEDIPTEDENLISAVAEMSEQRESLYALANELWLAADPALSIAQRRRRLLATQLHYLHRMPWTEICAIMGSEPGLNRDKLNKWLVNPGVLNHFAYHSLYLKNDALVGYLLDPDKPLTEKELDTLQGAAARSLGVKPEGWTWPEIKVVLWRYRNGLSTTKILQMDPTLNPACVESAVAKCRERLPFRRIAAKISDALRSGHAPCDPLQSPGLWKRLAFQYHTFDELPHKQILERTEPAAHESGFVLTAGMLNVWLSNGRLFQQLASFAARSKEK